MYNVPFTIYNLAGTVMACTMYHLLCTIQLAQKGIFSQNETMSK